MTKSVTFVFLHWGSVIFYREGGLLKIGGIRYFFLDQKRDEKIFQIKKGDHLYFFKEIKYFVKHSWSSR